MSKINPWIKFVKEFREKNPELSSYKDALKEASKVYKKPVGGSLSGGGKKNKKKPMKKSKKMKGGSILSGVNAPVDLIIKKVKKVKK